MSIDLNKLKKIRDMMHDTSLTDEERESWAIRYEALKEKYNYVDSDLVEETRTMRTIKHKNEYMKHIFIKLTYGLGIQPYLNSKRCRKLASRVNVTDDQYAMLMDEYAYYSDKLEIVLEAALQVFSGSHLPDTHHTLKKANDDRPSKLTKRDYEILEAMRGMDHISNMDINNKKKLTGGRGR